MRRWLVVLAAAAVGALTVAAVTQAAPEPAPAADPNIVCDVTIMDVPNVCHAVAATTTTEATTSTTTSTTIAVTVAPSTAAPSTTAATTTTLAPTTTRAPTTTASPSTSTTTSSPGSTSTTQPSGSNACAAVSAAFCEDFEVPADFYSRFDHGWSGEIDAGALFGEDRNDWHGDHDMNCGNPNSTQRTIHVDADTKNTEQAFYPCLPSGDPSKGHLMTSINTEGYVVGWFSPKPTFVNVRKVCWSQSEFQVGGGNWTQVTFLTPAEVSRARGDLGFTSPEFPAGGPSTPQGSALFGVKDFGTFTAWSNGGDFVGSVPSPRVTDKSPRYQRCVEDLGVGQLRLTAQQPNGTIAAQTVAGQIPDGPIRVVFNHDTYNPEKHYNTATNDGAAAPDGIFSWHWDDIQIYT